MSHRLFLSIIMATLLANPVSAGAMGSAVTPPKAWTWAGSVSVGPVWASAGKTQTFYLTPEIEKTYSAQKSAQVLSLSEVFIGIQKSLSSSQWIGQLGLAVSATDNAKLQGTIWDDANPAFDNYHYAYKVRSTQLSVKTKLLLDKSYWLMPWVSGSLGLAFNKAHDFTNMPLIFEALPNPNFTNYTKTTLIYTLSAGIQKSLNEHWQVGAGYQFADWGNNKLGRALGQTMHSGLALNHLYTNGLLFNLTFVA